MGIVAAELGQLLALKADIAFLTLKQIHASNKLTNIQAQLTKEQKYEDEWDKAYDKCFDAEAKDQEKFGIYTVGTEAGAIAYANFKVVDYDPARLAELNELDIEYDTMKTMYDTMLQEDRALLDSLKGLVEKDAADTNMSSAS